MPQTLIVKNIKSTTHNKGNTVAWSMPVFLCNLLCRILNVKVKKWDLEPLKVSEQWKGIFDPVLFGKPHHIQKIPGRATHAFFFFFFSWIRIYNLTNLVKTSLIIAWSHVETNFIYGTPFKELPHIACTEELPSLFSTWPLLPQQPAIIQQEQCPYIPVSSVFLPRLFVRDALT